MKKWHIIINPGAGKVEPILPVFNEVMNNAHIDWDISITKETGDGAKLAKAALKKGVDVLGVYGGDGTVMEVVSGLVGSKVPLAIFPGGTANVLSKELGLAQDLKEACQLLTGPSTKVRPVDIACNGHKYFILRASLGFEADMVKGAKRETKNRFGQLAYVLAAFDAFRKIKDVKYEITIDGKSHIVRGVTCVIANSGNVGLTGVTFDKDINVSDGLLDVIVVKQAPIRIFAYAIATLWRQHLPRNMQLVSHWQGKEVSVASKPSQNVQWDGEVLAKGSLKVKVLESAVNVIVTERGF